MTAKTSYEDYLKLALQHKLRFLHHADELPPSVYHRALWQCLVTGEVFARTYSQIKFRSDEVSNQFASPGQHFWFDYRDKFYALAAELGIEFMYEEGVDLAPYSIKVEVKWRGKAILPPAGAGERRIVVASYHQLAYDQIRSDHARDLGIASEINRIMASRKAARS